MLAARGVAADRSDGDHILTNTTGNRPDRRDTLAAHHARDTRIVAILDRLTHSLPDTCDRPTAGPLYVS